MSSSALTNVTNAVKFIFWGAGSFLCWDYMIASGNGFYAALPNSLKAIFLILVPSVTAAYLNLTQMWHLQNLLGKQNSQFYIRLMAVLVLLSNGTLKNGL